MNSFTLSTPGSGTPCYVYYSVLLEALRCRHFVIIKESQRELDDKPSPLKERIINIKIIGKMFYFDKVLNSTKIPKKRLQNF